MHLPGLGKPLRSSADGRRYSGANHHGDPDGEVSGPGLGHRNLFMHKNERRDRSTGREKKKWLVEEWETTVISANGIQFRHQACSNCRFMQHQILVVMFFFLGRKTIHEENGLAGPKVVVNPPIRLSETIVLHKFHPFEIYGILFSDIFFKFVSHGKETVTVPKLLWQHLLKEKKTRQEESKCENLFDLKI